MRGLMRRPRTPTNSALSSGRANSLRTARPGGERRARLAAHRHQAQLAALAEDADFAFLHHGIEHIAIEGDQFGQAQAGRVEQFEHGQIARRLHWIVILDRLQQTRRFVHRQGLGQQTRRSWAAGCHRTGWP